MVYGDQFNLVFSQEEEDHKYKVYNYKGGAEDYSYLNLDQIGCNR